MRFSKWRTEQAERNWQDSELLDASQHWHTVSRENHYQYMLKSCGLPIIQDPQDICILSELIWDFKPDVIIETGIARGGSIVHHAHSLAALDYIDQNNGISKRRRVIGIDIDIRDETRVALTNHPLAFMFDLIEGSSIAADTIKAVNDRVGDQEKTMVILDSNHEEQHVNAELEHYSKLVTNGMPLFVMDTGIEFAPADSFAEERPWGKGSNPYTAMKTFLDTDTGNDFSINLEYEKRYILSSSPSGLLIRN